MFCMVQHNHLVMSVELVEGDGTCGLLTVM